MKPITRVSFVIGLPILITIFLFGYTCSSSNGESKENFRNKSKMMGEPVVDLKMNTRSILRASK